MLLDSKSLNVIFCCCDSIAMRSVMVATMLFSEEEPIIAHIMALMEKSIVNKIGLLLCHSHIMLRLRLRLRLRLTWT